MSAVTRPTGPEVPSPAPEPALGIYPPRATQPERAAPERPSRPLRGTTDRLALTRQAPRVMRRHLSRALVRTVVLLAGDVAALLVLRQLMRGARDGWFGPALSALFNRMVPPGVFPMSQLLPAVLLGLVVLDNYGSSDRRRDAARLLAGATFGLVLPFWSHLWSSAFNPLAVPGFVMVAGIVGAALVTERYLIDTGVRRLFPVGPGAARALLVGSPDETLRALEHPLLSDKREFLIGGMVNPTELVGRGGRIGRGQLWQAITRYRADTLVLVGTMSDELFATLIEVASSTGCQVYSLTRSFDLAGVEPRVIWRRGAPLVALTRPTLRGRQLLIKRTVDLLVSGVGLVVLAPLFALIAVAVRLSSPGPVFFRQTRVGLGGSTFTIAKFRSMVVDAEARRDELREQSLYRDARLFKLKHDPRVTPLGAFLRRTSLDELPQLWNVFRGDMSLVGPRPPLPCEVDLYEEHHYTRFDVKPGITGPWQVNGRNKVTDFEEVIRLETDYIRDWTLWKDLAILLRTVPAVFRMEGAH